MSLLVERTVFRTGEASVAVTLPIAWVRYVGLQPGHKVEIVIDDDLIIRARGKRREKGKYLYKNNV